MSIRVNKIEDTVPMNKTKTVSGVIKQFEKVEKKQYRPSLYSIHIFPFSEDNIIFIQNGVKYARCFGESISASECDPKIQQQVQQNQFTLPDYRGKVLKQTNKTHTQLVDITPNHLPHHQHQFTVKEPVRYNLGNGQGVKGDDKNTGDNWIDVVLSTKKKQIQTAMYEKKQQINVNDSSLNVIFGMVIGYV